MYKQQNQGPQSDIRDPAGRSYSTHEDAFSPAYLHNPLQPGQQFLGTYPTISPPGVLPYQQMQPGHYAQHTQMAPPGAVYQLHTGAGNYFEGQPSHFQPAPLYQTIDPTGRVSTPYSKSHTRTRPLLVKCLSILHVSIHRTTPNLARSRKIILLYRP